MATKKSKSKAAKVPPGKARKRGRTDLKGTDRAQDTAAVLPPDPVPTQATKVAVKVDKKSRPERSLSEVLRVDRGFVLADCDPASTPGFDSGSKTGERAVEQYAPEVGEWQERLFAETKRGGNRALLLVVQGMDCSGKGGIMRHVVSILDPEGVRATAFKAPTPEEREHDFLWRIRNALPKPGQIGVFDRSHYEDVLIAKVRRLVPATEIVKRYALINAFEREVIASGTQIVKVMMHISKDEQKARLMERLDRPDKNYKYNPGDVDERGRWDAYMAAYQTVLNRTSTRVAPWHVVPADKKWFARYAVQQLVLEALRDMHPQWPIMDFDVEAEKERVRAS
jgi:PPK2 family polyphosphate:nucleotide phosphotransferase